jgi:alpha-L-rhamnosidase
LRARYVRVTATRLWNRKSGPEPFCFALAELEVFSAGSNVALRLAARALDSVERSGWSLNQLTDGVKPVQVRVLPSHRPERSKEQRDGQGAATNAHPPYAAVLLRKEVTLAKPPVRATAYVSGLGYYELYLNGKKVGDHVLDPGFTDYTKRVFYVTHDVTDLLEAGRSAIGVVLGGGWYDSPAMDEWSFHTAPWIAPPKLLLRLDLDYSDGSTETIVSDASWKHSTGPIVFNSIRGGETYDARREKPGWNKPGYDDSAWSNARIAPAPKGRLQAQYHPPIRVVASMRPVKLTEPKPGVYVFDLGVNTAGWARLTTRGERGRKITLGFDERLNGDGTLRMENRGLTHGRYQTDEFILAGGGDETFEPRFSYYGFRYVQVTGLTEKPTLDSLVGRAVHTDPEPAGEFSCSNPDVNRIHEMILRTQLANLHGIPTDCPHREKIGWTGDGYITMEEAIYNFRMPGFYLKWWRDMLDVQDANGHASCIAPSPGWGRSNPDGSPHFLSDPWWGGALVRLPWKHYRYYGDRRILEEAYEPMKKYLDYAATRSPGHISWANEGDWLPVAATPVQLAGTAAYFLHATIVAEVARLLGKADDAARYSRLAEDISSAFHKKYFDAQSGFYFKDSQTAQALPLTFGMTPADKRELVLRRLLENITQTRSNHISSGIIGTYYVFQTLMEEGHDDVAYAMLTQKDFPGWLHMLNQGGTTVWEAWNGKGSRNHPAFGSVGAWFYRGLGGIRLDPTTPAFKRFVIKPAVVGDLTWVKCSYQSAHGKIESNWRREAGKLRLAVTIPFNTTATVHVPTSQPDAVTESGQPAGGANGVKFLRAEKAAAIYEVGSGNYVFEGPFSLSSSTER